MAVVVLASRVIYLQRAVSSMSLAVLFCLHSSFSFCVPRQSGGAAIERKHRVRLAADATFFLLS